MIVQNKEGTLYELNGLQWDESAGKYGNGSWLASLTLIRKWKESNHAFRITGHEVRLPLASFTNHFTPTLLHMVSTRIIENLVAGVHCNKCGNTLPAHTESQHLDENDPIHACPHEEKTDGNDGT